jgi:hypothetical protein
MSESNLRTFCWLVIGAMIVILFVLLITSLGHAAGPPTFLVSDPADGNATSCVFDTLAIPCVLDASKAVHTNITGLGIAPYTVRAAFCEGAWCSEWSLPLGFSRPVPIGAPHNLRPSR